MVQTELADDQRPSVDEIYHELRRQISLLERAPGSRLREEPLAREFGVSRTPVRQVLARLQHERLVSHEPGAGATVAIIDSKEVRDVWAVRLKLTELTGSFTSLPAAPDVIDELEDIVDALDEVRVTREHQALGALYGHFYLTVMSTCTSTTMRRISEQLFHLTTREWLQFLPELDLDNEIDAMADEVTATIDALRDDDPEKLTAIRLDHMKRLLRRFNDHLSRPLG